MYAFWPALLLFAAKTLIIFLFILFVLMTFFALIAKAKAAKNHIVIKNLNRHYEETAEIIYAETLAKKQFKLFLKKQKVQEKKLNNKSRKTVFILQFNGDIKASAVNALREEITAVLKVAEEADEVVLRLESPGGLVHSYGLAAAQLLRLRAQNIFLTVIVDKVAASGGYLMACVANKILSAPYAIIGSIGVLVQLPNFNRLLKENNIDFEQHAAGEYKRTLTVFGENTESAREKLHQELEAVHGLFKELIVEHRPHLNIEQVATGEYWLGKQALALELIDGIETSDDYLLNLSKHANLFELCYTSRKSFSQKLSEKMHLGFVALKQGLLNWMTT